MDLLRSVKKSPDLVVITYDFVIGQYNHDFETDILINGTHSSGFISSNNTNLNKYGRVLRNASSSKTLILQ
jgi:hypothetical protein